MAVEQEAESVRVVAVAIRVEALVSQEVGQELASGLV